MLRRLTFKGLSVIALGIAVIGFSVDGFGQPPWPRRDRDTVKQHRDRTAVKHHRKRDATKHHRKRDAVKNHRRRDAVKHHRRRAIIRHSLPYHGRVIVNLPSGHRRIVIKKDIYYFYSGIFYQIDRGGYVVVSAPIGAIVVGLPIGYVTFISSDITYYFYGGVYYRKVPAGYIVVEPPPDAVIVQEPPDTIEDQASIGDRVSVTAYRLNVRLGPGKEHPVIDRVYRDSILVIYGFAPGWYYVRLANGKYGWVDKAYTKPVLPPASG
jgi:uncharacterized protein YraI